MQQVSAAKSKIPGLDSLRGALSLTVVVAHAWQIFVHPLDRYDSAALVFFGLSARCAVLAFFCLSGYVIALSIGQNRNRHGSFQPWDYSLSRVFRIVPPLLAVFAITFLMQLILHAMDADIVGSDRAARQIFTTDVADQFRALRTLCINGDLAGMGLNGPLWTLAFEIQLYVVAGLLATIFFSRRAVIRIAAIFLLVHYLRKIGMPIKKLPTLNAHSVMFFSFCFGAIAYHYRSTPLKGLGVIVMLLAGCAGLAAFLADSNLRDLDVSTPWLAFQVALSGCFSIGVLLIDRFGRFGFLHRMGEYSYTLYIIHFPVLLFGYFLVWHFTPDTLNSTAALVITVLSVPLVLLLAIYIGRAVERPRTQKLFTTNGVRFVAVQISRWIPQPALLLAARLKPRDR